VVQRPQTVFEVNTFSKKVRHRQRILDDPILEYFYILTTETFFVCLFCLRYTTILI